MPLVGMSSCDCVRKLQGLLATGSCCAAGARNRVEPTSNSKEASGRRQDSDVGRPADGRTVRGKSSEAAKRVSSADRNERQKAKPNSGIFCLVQAAASPCPALPSLLPLLDPEAQFFCLATALLARLL